MKEHFCSAEKSMITYEGSCNWCGEREGSMIEVLKQALEALENPNSGLVPHNGEWRSRQSIAITAIKEALAQPEQEPVKYSDYEPDGVHHNKPQRTWVGLTNEELTDLFYNTNLGQQSAVSQAVALLKERNS